MSKPNNGSIIEHFAGLQDPRVDLTKHHELLDIIICPHNRIQDFIPQDQWHIRYSLTCRYRPSTGRLILVRSCPARGDRLL